MDPHQRCNLDRFLDASTNKILIGQECSFKQFFESYSEVSMFGLQVELFNEETCEAEVYTYMPTLSSLSLTYHKLVQSQASDDMCGSDQYRQERT